MFQEPYIAKIQYLYSGCQVFRHFLSIAKTIFLIAFTILKIAFAIRQECRTRHFNFNFSFVFTACAEWGNVIKNLILLYIII